MTIAPDRGTKRRRKREYFLYIDAASFHGSDVRALLVSAVLSATIITAHAQQQEQKLLDRLLKPEMSLENSAQGKQFTAGGATIGKQARTKSFYVRYRRAEKQFVTGDFST